MRPFRFVSAFQNQIKGGSRDVLIKNCARTDELAREIDQVIIDRNQRGS
jgi:hypothetical protein